MKLWTNSQCSFILLIMIYFVRLAIEELWAAHEGSFILHYLSKDHEILKNWKLNNRIVRVGKGMMELVEFLPLLSIQYIYLYTYFHKLRPHYLNTIISKGGRSGKNIDNSLSVNYGLPHVSTIFGLKLNDHEGRFTFYTVRGC